MNKGYVVAEGNIHGVRDEMEEHRCRSDRCDKPANLVRRIFAEDNVVEARLHNDRGDLRAHARPGQLLLVIESGGAEGEINMESVAPVDDDLRAV